MAQWVKALVVMMVASYHRTLVRFLAAALPMDLAPCENLRKQPETAPVLGFLPQTGPVPGIAIV